MRYLLLLLVFIPICIAATPVGTFTTTVPDIKADEPLHLTVPSDVPISQLIVTLSKSVSSFSIRIDKYNTLPEIIPVPNATVHGYFRIREFAGQNIPLDELSFLVPVSRSFANEHTDILLLIYDTNWTAIPTELDSSTDSTYIMKGTTNSLGYFAISTKNSLPVVPVVETQEQSAPIITQGTPPAVKQKSSNLGLIYIALVFFAGAGGLFFLTHLRHKKKYRPDYVNEAKITHRSTETNAKKFILKMTKQGKSHGFIVNKLLEKGVALETINAEYQYLYKKYPHEMQKV